MRIARSALLAFLVCSASFADAASAQSQNPTKGLFGKRTEGPVPEVDRDTLAPDELKLDCRKLAGRMQIRIMQVRSETARDAPSAVASTVQSVTRPIYGGTRYGSDTMRQTSRDRAWLEAANRQLAAKGCRTYDLAAELAKPAGSPPPVLQAKPAAAPAAPVQGK